ncbi:TOPRIM domain-containing protein [Burkholderia sp. SJ98]|uniref:AAA family ATPase n=1 Tax=Caballeronia zhejiangensis TaxID=871203 RepID=UPI00025B9C9B|nr:AAA family ATPase [Caballeronia zhejiangensis]EKS73142.1 TOPRIM domain-containing protein [Burkholderia sp. SJ98]
MSDVINIENQFADALADEGFPSTEIVADGKIHRFAGAEDKAGKKNAWYVLHIDRFGAGAFGDWKRGIKATWCSKAENSFSPEERSQWRQQQQAIRAAVEKETKQRNAEAAAKAKRIWDNARDATDDNPYCVVKGIKPYGLKEFKDARTLIVPVRNAKGHLVSAQFIYADGTKRFLSGGEKAGCYYSFGPKPKERIVIAEGFATAASLYEATGLPVAVAFDCGNLRSVAAAVKANLPPNCKVTIAADDDAGTAGNPGISAATEAARAVDGLLAVPDFGEDRPAGSSDFNDLAKHAGLEAVKFCIAAATRPGGVASDKKRRSPTVNLSCAADVTPEPIHWLWPGWLPAGKLSILAGQPGCGKTTIAISLSAAISKGAEWPDGTRCKTPGNILIWTGEDGIADTLVPRLMAAGADLRRVFFVESVTDEIGELQPFDPSRDVPILAERIESIGGASLLVVDPIISVVNGDSHKSGDVRKSLQPLIDLGSAHGCAILGITHFSKGSKGSSPTERILGSQAFGAAARMILIAGKDDSSDRRIFAKSKCNIAGDTGGFEYAIETLDAQDGLASSRITWGEPLDGSAKEILRELEADENETEQNDDRESKFERARCMLYEWLTPFMSTKEMKSAAQAEGVSWRMVESAKAAEVAAGNKIRAVKHGNAWGWIWDHYEAKHGKSTPQLHVVSSPQEIQVRNGDCGVETLTQQGFEGKSATPQSLSGDVEHPEATPQPESNSAASENHCGVADLAAKPYPARVSTPQSTPQSKNACGVDKTVGGDL